MKQLGREYRVAAIGELMMMRPISVYEEPDFLSVIKLFRDADVAITNVEGLPNNFKGYQGLTGGTPTSAESWIADEYKWAGFNLVSIANNHTMDYGEGGLMAAMEALDKARLMYAGGGKDLWDARQPAYVETRKGRAAMVASATFEIGRGDINMATESGKGVRGRPGLNPLRYDTIYTVTTQQFKELKKLNEQWHISARGPPPIYPKIEKEEINFLGRRIVDGDEPSFKYIAVRKDVEGNLQSIRNAKSNSGLVIASNHAHESDPALRSEWGNIPPEYIRKYARECIDSGADVYYGHGDHAGQGMEIYKGRPIFYGLANPIVTSQNIKRLSLEEYERYDLDPEKTTIAEWMAIRDRHWGGGSPMYAGDRWVKAVVATFTMQDGKLTELKLHPIDGSAGEPQGSLVHRGVRPLMVKGAEARKIIERYAKLSEPLGTEVEFKDGVGIVKV